MAESPVLVEVVRSGFVESVHHGRVVALSAAGDRVLDVGATDEPMFPRSSNKPLQAVGLLRAGLDVEGGDLAVVAGSHSGEPFHVERVRALLARFGLTEAALRCPPSLPIDPVAAAAASGPAPIAMNCSGKHAGMLAACVAAGWPTDGYTEPDHPLQKAIRQAVEEISAEAVTAVGVDGCGAPVLALTLTGLARAFGRLVTAPAGTPERRVADAMRAHPELVAGTHEPDTALMRAVPGLLVKGGAEGVHAGALPDGAAVALKIDDGGMRGRGPVLVAALARLGVDPAPLAEWATPAVVGGGRPVGAIRLCAGVLGQ